MRGAIFAFAAVGALTGDPAFGACTKLAGPSCAIEGAFARAWDQDQCRKQMLPYKRAMELFAACLKEEGQDEKSALDELEYTLAEFNRRSRELPADDL